MCDTALLRTWYASERRSVPLSISCLLCAATGSEATKLLWSPLPHFREQNKSAVLYSSGPYGSDLPNLLPVKTPPPQIPVYDIRLRPHVRGADHLFLTPCVFTPHLFETLVYTTFFLFLSGCTSRGHNRNEVTQYAFFFSREAFDRPSFLPPPLLSSRLWFVFCSTQ